jgi:hypothetical protein
MHGAYSHRRVKEQESMARQVSRKEIALSRGKKDDWGKTQPFWCLSCGQGFASVKRVFAHYAQAGHGNETMSVGARGLTKKQRLEAFRLMNESETVISETDQKRLDALRDQIRSAETDLVEFGFDARRGIETYSRSDLQRLITRSRDQGRVRSALRKVVELQEQLYRELYALSGTKELGIDTDTPEKALLLVKRTLEMKRREPSEIDSKLQETVKMILAAFEADMPEDDRRKAVMSALTKSYRRDYDRNRVLNLVLTKLKISTGTSSLSSLEELASLLVKRAKTSSLKELEERAR